MSRYVLNGLTLFMHYILVFLPLMIRAIFIIIVSIFTCIVAHSATYNQIQIDSLTQRLHSSDEDTTTIDIRLNLASVYASFDRTASFINIEEAIRISIQIGDKERLALSYEAMGDYYYWNSLFSDALHYFGMSEQLFEQVYNKEARARLLGRIGVIYGQKGAHFESLSVFEKCLKIRTELNDSVGIASIYNNLGNVYLDLGKLEMADSYYLQALEIYRVTDHTEQVAKMFNNLGLVALEIPDLIKAEKYFKSATGLYEEMGQVEEIGNSYIHLGVTFIRKLDFDSAAYYFQKSSLIITDQNNHYTNLHLKLSKTELLLAQGNYQDALVLAKESYESAKKMNLLSPQKQALDCLYKSYVGLEDYKQALFYHEEFVRMQDSILRGGDQFEFEQLQNRKTVGASFMELESKMDETKAMTNPFWKENWFLILTFFLLLGVLIVSLEFRRKSALNKDGIDYKNVDYIRSTRILYLLAAIMFLFVPLIIPNVTANLSDPFVYRIIISSLILTVYLMTFWSHWVRAYIDIITKIFYIVLVTYTFYLLYINQIAVEHFVELVIIMAAITVVFKRLKDLVVISLYVLLLALFLFYKLPNPHLHPLLFLIALISILFVATVSGLSKLDLDEHLEFSNEVVRHADALVFIVNRKGENIYASQSAKSILGYTPQELRAHDWMERMGLEKSEANRITNELILIAIGTIEPGFNPYQRLVSKNGKEVWLSFKERRLSNNRVLIVGLDVTENKRIQDDLEASEHNFRQINETLSDVFYLYNLLDEKYEYISPNSAEIIGPTTKFFYDKQDYIGTFIIPEDQQKTRKGYSLINKGLPFDLEYRIKIGANLKWIREKSHPILDDYGRVIKHAGLCQDITDRKNAEQEIQKLSLIASNTDNFILMVDKENRVEWANNSFYNLTGFKEIETIGKLPLELISGPLTSESTIELIAKAIFEDKRQMQCELINYKADGTLFYSNIEVTPLLDEFGKFEKYFVIGSDISQRIADQEQIEKLSLVASNTSNYIIIAHVDKGIEWVNQAFVDKFGYTLEESIGHFPSQLIHDSTDGKDIAELINKTVFEEGEKFKGEIIHLTKEKKPIYSNVDITPLFGDDGKTEKYFVVGVDISESKKYEAKIELANSDLLLKEQLLNESEQNFRELIRSIKEVFYLRDSVTGEFIFVSDSYAEVFGQPVDELISDPTSWIRNIHPQDKERIKQAFNSRKENEDFNEDFRLILPSGEQKWVNSRVFQILNDKGEVVKVSGFTEDITEKKEQELEIKRIADQLDIIHAIEKTILEAESTEEIIYNTLNKTIDKLPILRASLTLFNPEENTFYAYARLKDEEEQVTDGKEFPLNEFSLYKSILDTKSNYFQNLVTKENLSPTDKLLVEQGAKLLMLSPLLHGDQLIGSLNVCFTDEYIEDDDHYIRVTNEVANGLAIAIQQSQLKDKLHLVNRAVNSSIEYAKMIQQAYIPSTLSIGSTFENHFILNRPKDIVSGDFYWTGQFGAIKIMAVGDCTGHGVPGAFMTIIGISELNNIVNQRGIVDPAEILKALNCAIVGALSSSATIQLKDGMDIAIFAYNTETKTICFEGARRPLYQLRGEELHVINSAKLSIGDVGDNFGITFESKQIDFEAEDVFYLFSDGITDQFGGPRQRKFTRRRLEDCIIANKDLPIAEQGKRLKEELIAWQGGMYQTDDMVFIAFKIGD